MTLRARILSQGDEITSGATLDINSQWLAQRLFARGVEVVGFAAAPDDLEALTALLRHAAADADLVVSTGGLGPTTDDLSAEAAALAAGVALREDPVALEQVIARFRKIERPMPPINAKQALLPAGSTVLENTAGSAPGFALDIGRARAFFFPGVPRELHVMAPMHLDPWLEGRGLVPSLRRRFHFCGPGESALQERLADLELGPGVRLGYKTWAPYNTIVLYAGRTASAAFEQASVAVRARLGGDCFGEDDATLASVVGEALVARGLTVAVAESCTAGMTLALLTSVPGSSAWVKGGVVAYANEVKRDLLGVPAEVLEKDGAVSEAAARAMAEGVRRVTGASVGLAITGVAGPGGGSAVKPVGMVCFGLATGDLAEARTVRFGDRGRDVVREVSAAHAIEWLRRWLGGRDQGLG